MPFHNEAPHLPAVLASLGAQVDGAGRPLRPTLIAVDDRSTDGGAAIVERWLAESGWAGEVVPFDARNIASALNRGLSQVPDDAFVIRVDAHTVYAPDYVATILNAFATLPADVWCVGGNHELTEPTSFGRALHAALFRSPMGFGPADYRTFDEVKPVSSVYLGAWRPNVLRTLGGYDERWRANEDAELAERVREAGGSVVRVPAHSRKILTRGARAALRQWMRYGYWRAQTIAAHPRSIRLRHVAPPVALAGAVVLAISPARLALLPLAAAYAVMTVMLRPPGQSAAVTAASLVFFPLVHAGYACGMIAGGIASLARRPKERRGRPRYERGTPSEEIV
ncbi:MAG TPA: glycosyltransferase [Candidatus Elarobacter sp.]|jgi:succinoglycan biosynthesis protein ExoA|nr:glycosyltransferase [Candidatus Elarobacter sp.]